MKKTILLATAALLLLASTGLALEWRGSNSGDLNFGSGFGSSSDDTPKVPVFLPEDCVGSVVNGRCRGFTKGPQKYCYGTVTNGECNGTIGY